MLYICLVKKLIYFLQCFLRMKIFLQCRNGIIVIQEIFLTQRLTFLNIKVHHNSDFINFKVQQKVIIPLKSFLLSLTKEHNLTFLKIDLCYPECLERSFKITKSSIKLNGESQRDLVHIKMFFSTLTKEIIEIRPKTRSEILCKISSLSNLSKYICTFFQLQLMLEEPLEC